MRERHEEENVAFLRREFGTENGRGIEHEGREYAVWFMNDGIHFAEGSSVRTGGRRTTLTWEQASARILELLQNGTYLSPAELAQAQDKTMGDMADALILTARDLTEEGRVLGLFPQTRAAYDKIAGFPDCTRALAEQARDGTFLASLAQEYHSFLDAYQNDRQIMRFRLSDYNTHRIGSVLDGVAYPARSFTAQPDFLRQCKMFITQDEIDQHFLGSDADSRLSIYSHFCYAHTTQEHQAFIKSSYGEYSGGARDGYDYTKTHKGLTYRREYEWKEYDSVQLTIPQVVREHGKLIVQKRFPGEDAIAKIPVYEAERLARTVYFGFSGLYGEVPKPYPGSADYYDAVPAIQTQLADPERVREMADTLAATLGGLQEDDRYYSTIQTAHRQLTEYADGSFSLFNHLHDGKAAEEAIESDFVRQVFADAAAVAAMPPEPYERFHVMETEDGYAVWDDVRDEIYVDDEGVSAEFDSVWQADTYLEQVKKTVADKEAAEWLYVEHAKLPPAEPDKVLATPVPKKKERLDVVYPLYRDSINYRITDDTLGAGTPSERYANNVAAIRLLKTIEGENRTATADEQGILARYVGWGGLADCFDEKNAKYGELRSLLSDIEYAPARESTLTAFYTPPVVIRSIYQALEGMSFAQGNILEPACGTGNFLGMLPESMVNSKLYGVELDDISGRIARQLYQKSAITMQGFEKTDFPDNFFDVAVGNVPFGQFKVADRRYDRLNLPIHEYFIAKTLDKVRPGGVVAFVTSSFTMDKRNSKYPQVHCPAGRAAGCYPTSQQHVQSQRGHGSDLRYSVLAKTQPHGRYRT